MSFVTYLFILRLVLSLSSRNFYPPSKDHLWNHTSCLQGDIATDPTHNCHGAKFALSRGFFQPCSRHSHCYAAREPSDWCILPTHHIWTNWGCHCDRKLASCVIEKYDAFNRSLQWAYCTPKSEFYCENYHQIANRRLNTFITFVVR